MNFNKYNIISNNSSVGICRVHGKYIISQSHSNTCPKCSNITSGSISKSTPKKQIQGKENIEPDVNGRVLEMLFPKGDVKQIDKEDFELKCPDNAYQPITLDKRSRIIVIGDVHGDLGVTLKCLKLAKVIDENNDWIGGDTVVVQIGDQVDRCRPIKYGCADPRETVNDEASDIKIMKLFTKLHNQAEKQGGHVYSLLGNHEILNVFGKFNYVSYEGLKEFEDYKDPNNPTKKFSSGADARRHAFKPGNEYARFLACTRVPILTIGSFMFVHAGLTPEFISKVGANNIDDLYRLSYVIRNWLLGKVQAKDINNIVGTHSYSPFWERVLGAIPPGVDKSDPTCVRFLEPVLKLFKVNHMVIGHTPQFYANGDGINATCGNALWRVDTGSSQAFQAFDKSNKGVIDYSDNKLAIMDIRNAQVLEITNDKDIRVLK